MKSKHLPLTFFILFLAFQVAAQNTMYPTKAPYISTGIDGCILSTAHGAKLPGQSFGTPRVTGFFHAGANLNYDFNKHLGMYTGLNIKNIGFIEQRNNPDSTIKRRVYAFGVPLGFKVGDVKFGSYVLFGGGVDFPFNYKEKGFVNRGDKTKFNEWFGSRTPAVMPYVFVGAHLRPVVALKLQYYPANFLNGGYIANGGGKPYTGYNVHLVMLTAGFDISYYPKK
ncbi:MAG: hypothetical protein QM642_11670 [Edaphocola sp.]